MRRKIIFISLILIFSFGCFFQKNSKTIASTFLFKNKAFSFYDDYKMVFKETQNKNSPFFIDSLLSKLERFEKFSHDEKIALIVGGTSLKGYNDPRLSILYDEIYNFKKNKEYEKIIMWSDSCLDIFPLSIPALMSKNLTYRNMGKEDLAGINYAKVLILFSGIYATGIEEKKSFPYIAFSEESIEYYILFWAHLENYEFFDKEKDDFGNKIFQYVGYSDTVYFLIPRSNRHN